MATVTKKPAPTPPDAKAEPPGILRAFDTTFRFLASLKLAVASISTLAGTLAVATFIESQYGTAAVQELVYRTRGFALLLAFLGVNILCAALIRFPWTKRQTGFVITHAGLLVLLFGSFLSLKMADEGQVGMLEGEPPVSQVIRQDHPVIRVQKLDEQGVPSVEYAYPFFGGSFAWPAGREEVVTTSDDPFQIRLDDHIPASTPYTPVHEPAAGAGGQPALKASLWVKPPRMAEPYDALAEPGDPDPNWLVVDNPRIGRVTREIGPAMVAFQYVDGPHAAEKVDDFLHPPADPLTQKLARIHYTDKAGKPRVYEWAIQDADRGKTVNLPDSDLSATLESTALAPIPTSLDPHWVESHADPHDEASGGMGGAIPSVQFNVRKGDGPAVKHFGWAAWPMVPSVIDPKAEGESKELVRIGYFSPPDINRDPRKVMSGRFAVIEVMGTPDGQLYYRAIGRSGLGGVGPLATGKTVEPLGEAGSKTMLLKLKADAYLPSSTTRSVCKPLDLPPGQQGLPAAEVTMSVGGETKTFWARCPSGFTSDYQTVRFPGGAYRVAYDFERKPLDFSLKLTDFDVGMDRGTDTPASYTSEVLLNDPAQRIDDKQVTVTMNEPMTHRGWTFYQSNYIPLTDRSGRRTGQFMSVFSARYDPAWQVVYIGCALVVLGTFVQFYMRAGVFTDGGKRERQRADAKAAKAAGKQAKANGQPAPEVAPAPSPAVEEFEEL